MTRAEFRERCYQVIGNFFLRLMGLSEIPVCLADEEIGRFPANDEEEVEDMALQRQNRQLRGQGQQNTQGTGDQTYAQARAAGTAFPQPILAREKQSGEPVTVIAFGDIPGNSPSYLCVDDAGESNWLSLTSVQITDPRVLPLSQELMARIQDQQQQNLQQAR